MASVAECSMASVPIQKLAQLQEKLLQQPEARDDVHASGEDTSATDERATVIPESAHAYSTPKSSPKAPPRLSASKSAPAGEMDAMIQPSPSQEAFRTLTRASSFHGYPGGDTQPLESQVYRDYNASVVNATAATPKKTILNVQISPNGKATYDTVTSNDKTPKTCAEGDTGYIDLTKAWPDASPGAYSTSSNVDDLLESEHAQLQEENDAAGTQCTLQTPSVAGHKHNRDGEVLTSTGTTTKKTPGFTQFFGGGGEKGPILSATQLFNHTQAPSSPIPDGPRSDPILTRPSPNITHQISTSSPVMPASSPVATKHNRPPATAGGPRENYTSMHESQEWRAARFPEDLRLQIYVNEDILEDDEEDDVQRRRFEQKRIRRVMSDQALHEWSKVRAPSRPGSRPTSSPKPTTTIINLVTPATEKRVDPLYLDPTGDGVVSDEDVVMEDEPAGEDQQSDDEYDELGQAVLRSQSNVPEVDDDHGSTAEHDVEGEDDDLRNEELQNGSEQGSHHPATQYSAIADSQPLRQTEFHSIQSHKAGDLPTMSSFGPGSQYTVRTSADQAKLSSKTKPSTEPHLPHFHTTDEQPVPSSPPPLPSSAEAEIVEETEGVLPSPRHTGLRADAEPISDIRLEVPESDSRELVGSTQHFFEPTIADRRTEHEINTNMLFSTAQTHVSASDPLSKKNGAMISPLKNLASQQSKVASQSPRTAAGVRHFSDIATAASPPKASGETDLDIDAIVSDVVTADDQHFFKTVSSPSRERPQKRRKVVQESSDMSSLEFSGREIPQQSAMDDPNDIEQRTPGTNAVNHARDPTLQPLRDSPSKANERRAATPPTEEASDSAPDSVKKREEAGAKAASQLLSNRTRNTVKPASVRAGQKAKRTPASKSKPTKSDQPGEVATSEKTIQETIEDCGHLAHAQESDMPKVTASNRVFALFKGSFNNFYPAKWLGVLPDGLKYRVQFDDETVAPIETQHVRRLELRLGDTVKVDLRGMRNKTWLVKGLKSEKPNDKVAAAGTDIYGHTRVMVEAKSTRTSAADNENGKAVEPTEEVAISSIYLTHTTWSHFADRTFKPPAASTSASSRLATPLSGLQKPDLEISATKSRRQIIPTAKVQANKISFREASVASTDPGTGAGLFAGMAFAISYGSNEAEKADVTRMILRNGGIILEKGFDELFHLPDLGESTTSPKKQSRSDDEDEMEDGGLMLKSEYVEFGFVALIADRHSRRAKYVQALSLGLPTLSGRWIADSLDTTKNTGVLNTEASPLPWAKYLLPSGESSYLGGAIRSRAMPIYDAKDANLHNTINNRDMLLNGDGVLIVASKKSKATWERRKAYAFLTLALGAGRVKRVSDVMEATAFVADDPEKWKWVYVDGSVADASEVMFGESRAIGKKRKRGEETVKIDAKAMSAGDGKVKIVNDEFVVQSLILGALVD